MGVNDTDELIYELQDQVQRVERKVSALLSLAGVDPDEAGRLPGEAPRRPDEAGPRKYTTVELPATVP